MDWSHWRVGFDQVGVLDLVGLLLWYRGPSDLRVDHESGTFADRIECKRFRSIRWLLCVEHIVFVADQTSTFGSRWVASKWSLPTFSIFQNAMCGLVRWRARFVGVMRNG